jgi:hypothetical protein
MGKEFGKELWKPFSEGKSLNTVSVARNTQECIHIICIGYVCAWVWERESHSHAYLMRKYVHENVYREKNTARLHTLHLKQSSVFITKHKSKERGHRVLKRPTLDISSTSSNAPGSTASDISELSRQLHSFPSPAPMHKDVSMLIILIRLLV